MTQADLRRELSALGLPVAYRVFRESVAPPFIVYLEVNSADVMADNSNYVSVATHQIELYTALKDPPTEALVQDKLKSLRLPYAKFESWIETENLYQIVYEVQLIGG